MKYELEKQPEKRKKQIALLKSFLSNPGRFSILILGRRGTGKKIWIDKVIPEISKENVVSVNAAICKPEKKFWEQKLKEANKGLLLVEDVELLTLDNQQILFEGLGTTDGKFGFESKIYEVRIVFTSSKHISSLRDTESYLNHKFFDRIAQLVVKFPDFNECGNFIDKDLKVTWEKFEFKTAYPILLENWLKTNAQRLHGNFRDLDKLCINWNNYQIMGWLEEKIFNRIKIDFENYYHFPVAKKEALFEVHFSQDKTYKDTLDDFKKQYKAWAKEEFGSLRSAEKVLGVSKRTMDRW